VKIPSPMSEHMWRNLSSSAGRLATLRWILLLSVLVSPLESRAATLPPLGTAANFGVLGASEVTSTGGTAVIGDLGVSPGTAVTGFGPGTVSGTIYTGVGSNAGPAQDDALTAYNNADAQACDTDLTGQDLGGMTLTPGSYCFDSSAQLTGILTLDFQNDADAVFIFQIGSTLTTASGASVVTTNAAPSCSQVTWQVGSSATLGTGTAFLGNILASASVTATTGASIQGSFYALNGAVTLDNNSVDACQCASNAECIDDGNVCTDQVCAPTDPGADAFGCIQPNNTASCNDALFCTTGDICAGGICAGAPLDCGDGNLCTDDSCDEATDACLNVNNILPCDDALFCTDGDICSGGVCAGVPLLCGDGNLCTDDSCDEATDACLNINNVLPCDDTLFCTDGDICSGGVCAGVPLLCGDGNLCTDDSCDEATDACLNINNILPCDDTLFCTDGDICTGGICAGVPLLCGDGNLCTDDSCDEATDACLNVNNVLPCNDALSCTSGDICSGGICAGVPLECGDGNLCTDDSCNESTGTCLNVNNILPCNDALFCTEGDICTGGLCAGVPLLCGDGNICTDDSCDEATDACLNVNNILPCNDTLFCTNGDICSGGICAGVPLECGDGNLCTDDSCNESTGTCLNVNNILPCNDALFCTDGDLCTDGLCAGVPLECGDGNICTDNSCDEATDTCVSVNNILPCNDALFCTDGDLCTDGLCAGAPLDCGDGNICTDNSCDEATDTCVSVNNILPCDDELFCTNGDICSGGLCSGPVLDCSDSNICTNDLCDETIDACTNVNNTAPCDDGFFCTTGDICGSGICTGAPRTCDDASACTSDSCDETADSCLNVSSTCGNGVIDSSCGEVCDDPAGTEICNNGADDDGDGLPDCADPDCLVPGVGSCDLCQLQPPCIPILGDPAEVFVSPMDPRALRIGGTFRFHGRAFPTTDVVPTEEVFAMMVSNENGIIFRTELPAGALRRKDGRRWVYKNQDTAALLRDGGVSTLYLRTRRFNGELAYAVRIRLFANNSGATVPRMTTQLYLGDDVAFVTADWTLRNGRWVLHDRDY